MSPVSKLPELLTENGVQQRPQRGEPLRINNVISCEIVSDGGYVHFAMNGFAAERDHLRQPEDGEVKQEEINIVELHRAGKSVREIAAELGLSKSKVGRILQKVQQALSTAEESTEDQEEE